MLTVRVRDANLTPVGVVDDYLSLRFTQNWWQVGGFVMTIPATSAAVVELLAPGAGIIVTDGETVLFSGSVDVGAGGSPVAVREQVDQDGQVTDLVTLTGSDDMVWISDRVAHPAPESGNTGAQAYDVRSGVGSNVILAYLAANCGAGALVARRVPGIAFAADPSAGAFVTGQGRWQNLLTFLAELGRQAGVTLTARQVARQILVTVAATQDRSAGVVFGVDLGNVRSARFETTRSIATALYVAGQGEGTARQVATAASAGRRIEQFVDRRDITNLPELNVIAAAELVERVGASSLTVDPVDTAGFRFGVDYAVGDLVGVKVDGVRHTERVVSVETSLDASGMVRTLTLGQVADIGAVGLWSRLRAQSARINQLERV